LALFHSDNAHGVALLVRAHDELATALRDAEKYPWLGYPEAKHYFLSRAVQRSLVSP